MVVPSLTVAKNVFLGRQPRRGPGIVDWRRMRDQTQQVMADWGFDVNADTACGNLTVEQRQVVEITRALAAGTRCLLLDEPTAALERAEVTKDDLVTAMVGEKGIDAERSGVSAQGHAEPAGAEAGHRAQGGQVLSVEGVTFASPGVFLGDVSLTIRGGERVGVTGLRGSGATTLARIVAGAATPDAGQVRLGDRVLRPGDRAGALRAWHRLHPRGPAGGRVRAAAERGREHLDDDR